MKLTKQEEVLLNSNPLGFMVYAYLGLHPDTSVRELADLTSLKRTKCHELMRKYRPTSEPTNKPTNKPTTEKQYSKGEASEGRPANRLINRPANRLITTEQEQ